MDRLCCCRQRAADPRFHPTLEKHHTCGNGQTEAQCRATTAVAQGSSSRSGCPSRPTGRAATALMYFQQQERTYEGLAYDAGDRRWHKSRYLYADQDDYRLQQTGHTELQSTGGPVSQDLWTNQEVWVYDALNRVATAHHQYFAAGNEDTKAITTTEYDLATGVKLWTRAPRNHGTNLVESYAYDATKRFVTETTNELGHVVGREHEPGTGAVLYERGPSSSSCGSGCPNVEQTWTDVDGLGRPLATWVNREVPGNPVWQKTQVGQMSYQDSISPSGARTSVVTRSLVDYDGGLWSREETEVDGQGRPDVVTVTTGFNHDAVTTYDYDHRGLLVAVTVPDPSQDSTAVVTYTYGHDSLGRPTSMRRPAVGGATATGVDLTYDGLVHERTEVAGTAGGPEARTRLVHDVFGRLLEVHEYTDATSAAVTRYAYDAGDRVRRIENADGVVTELIHDFGGRRTRIERHGRVWTYTYNRSGDMTSEVAPAPGGGPDLAYTTTFAYDALGRQSSRSVGTRGLPPPDLALLGIGMITFTHDTCTNGVGRLCQISFPNGVLTTSLSYDAEGNVTEERRQFDFAGTTGERVAWTTYGPGGKVVAQTYGDHSVMPVAGVNLPMDDGTRATFEYDQRHLPLLVRWVKKPEPATVAVQVRNVAGLVTRRETHLLTQGWAELSSDWAYDPLTRVVSQTVTAELGPPLPQASVVLAKQQLDYSGQDDPSRLRHWRLGLLRLRVRARQAASQLARRRRDGGRHGRGLRVHDRRQAGERDRGRTPRARGELVRRGGVRTRRRPAQEAVSLPATTRAARCATRTTRTAAHGRADRLHTTELRVDDGGEDQLRRVTRTSPGAGVEATFTTTPPAGRRW
ncbi:MAG: RHS repeat protein [Kofleriaceae bacterium]|nr:RHS repeat protein [Kofleriaceae bacterium]